MKQFFYISILVLLSQMAWAQSPLDKRIDFEVKDMPLADAIVLLGKTSDIPISFSDDILPKNRKINLNVKDQSVKSILKEMLKNADVDFEAVGSQIILFYKKRPKRKFTISGFIKDKISGEALIAANVYEGNSVRGTFANEYGFFSLTLTEGEIDLYISYTGYESSRLNFVLEKNTFQEVLLSSNLEIPIVVVTPDEFLQNITEVEPLSQDNFKREDIENLPSLGGEVDLFRTVELLPGVQSGADGLGGLHVRGGSADQNLILMDGVPIYNPSHALGIFSVFNTEAIQSVNISKGAFPARYGGRLSSIMDVRTREGNSKHWSGSVKAGLIASSIRIEGPIIKDNSSILITARRTLLDRYIRNFTRKAKKSDPYFLENFNVPLQGFSEYSFYDLNGKLNFSLGKKDKFYFSYYNGGDSFRDEDNIEGADFRDFTYFDYQIQNYNWGNQIGVFRWNHVFGKRLFLNTTVTHSIFNFDVRESIEVDIVPRSTTPPINYFLGEAYFSELKDWGARLDFDFNTTKNHHLRFGVNSTLHTFEPGAFGANEKLDNEILFEVDIDSFLNANQISTHEHNVYFEDEFSIGKKWKFNAGILTNFFITEGKTYMEPQPRFSVNYLINSKLRLQGGVSRMVQPMHLLSGSDANFPNDLWVPSTRLVQPQTSWQSVLGFQYQPNEKYLISIEGYYKKLNNQILYLDNNSLRTELSNPANFTFAPITANNWESNITTGEGWNYGLEFQLKKSVGKTTGWLSYTWAFAERRYDDINAGQIFPYRFDRRHNLNISAIHRITPWLDISASWIYGTGLSTLIPTSTFTIGELTFINYEFARMPANHRLDAGINFHFSTKNINHQIYLGAYNLYNRANPQFFQIQTTLKENSDPTNPEFDFNVNQGSFLPFLPSVSYSVSF